MSQVQTGAARKAPLQRRDKRSAVAPSLDRDYCKIAVAYAKSAELPANKNKFGRWMKLACKRFLGDLQRVKAKSAPFVFDPVLGNNACDFIEKLPHIEGRWDTDNITLHESDIFFLVNLFGFRHEDGTRRFTSALKAIARKNAKSTIAAGIGLYCETCENENGPQVVSAATTGSQARIVFNIANTMVKRTAPLRDAFGLQSFANSISCADNQGFFKPINSKASSQDGLNPSCTILDEIHAHKSHDLINVLLSASGARDNPLFLYTTTEGYEQPGGPWQELRHFAKQVLLGVLEADHFFVVYFALDEEDKTEGIEKDDDFDERVWPKANPLMEVNPLLLKEMRKLAVEAKQMPGRLAEFRIKRLNLSAAAAGGFINLHKWRENTTPIDLDLLRKLPCTGGLDLASTSDMTVFRLAWLLPDGWIHTIGWRFVPTIAIGLRESRGLVPYRTWLDRGLLIEAGTDVTDYDIVEATILDAMATYNIQTVGYDPWNAKQLTSKLEEQGVPMEEFIQGPKSYHPALQQLERAYVAGKLVGIDPVLNWCASNLVVRTDANMNQAPDKKRAPEKIDDIVALLEAIGVAHIEAEEDPTEFLRDPICI